MILTIVQVFVSDEQTRKAVPAATTSRAFSPRADNGDFQPPHHTTPTEPLGFTLSNSQSERSGVPRYVIGTSTQDIFGGFGYSLCQNALDLKLGKSLILDFAPD